MPGKDRDKSGNPGQKPAGQGKNRAAPENPVESQASESESPTPKAPKGKDREAPEGRFPIVGIGASAGGLDALESFFSAVPPDSGLAFVVISHLDPDRESMLPELIGRKSKIPMKLIENGMQPEPDMAYLPPSNRDAVLKSGAFYLQERPDKSKLHMPIDLFFKYLAEDLGEFSACVVLSGTGTDGTQGLRLVKEKDGLTVAQTPETAKYAGMPESAIQTGLVDVVSPPPEIPERLIQYFKKYAGKEGREEEEETLPLKQILSFLANRTGNDFSMYKESTVIRRIKRRVSITHSRNMSEYLETLRREPKEVEALFRDLLIGVTAFFRDPEVFSFLKNEVLPDLVSREGREAFRVWIPGCSTGEEVYSVAILIREYLDEQDVSLDLQIFGTDLDAGAIEKARRGSYVQNIATDVGPERIERFFTREEDRYRVKDDIRQLVTFAEQNLLADPPFMNLDLLVCRNLLIYLKLEAQQRLIPVFHHALRDGAVLFLGPAEGVGRFHDHFEPVDRKFRIFRKKKHTISPTVRFPLGGERRARSENAGHAAEKPKPDRLSIGRAATKVLLEEYTPACVIVGREGEILYFHGRTGKYLEPAPGSASLQVAEMAREGLRFPLLAALRGVNREHREIRKTGVRVKNNGGIQQIDLIVRHLSEPPLENCRMVVFSDLPETAESSPEGRRPAGEDSERVAELEKELMRVQQDYRNAVEETQTYSEELKSTNEELHSSNEELQSTNEELESSREELQSLNEELNTVNSELLNKIEEIREAYKSTNIVLNNTRIAIVFLDKNLKVRRFTPEAGRLLNLIESDVGRPIAHISHNLEYGNLDEKARQVLEKLYNVDEEVRTKDAQWYAMRIMVYRPDKHITEGVVLTFINIDTQKRAQEELKEMSEREISAEKRFARNIVDTVRESLLVLDSRMRVITANRSFYESFFTAPEDTEGKSLFELGSGQWDIPRLRKLLDEIINKDEKFQDYLVEHSFPEIGFKRLLLNARMLRQEEGEGLRILLAMEDTTGKLKNPLAGEK